MYVHLYEQKLTVRTEICKIISKAKGIYLVSGDSIRGIHVESYVRNILAAATLSLASEGTSCQSKSSFHLCYFSPRGW
eukprot:363591-Ditylum_brightwellii.AAC.1